MLNFISKMLLNLTDLTNINPTAKMEFYIEAKSQSHVIVDLLKAIHRYYPIGMEDINETYPGQKELVKIAENKFSELELGVHEHLTKLHQNISLHFSQYLLTPDFHSQFPGYSF